MTDTNISAYNKSSQANPNIQNVYFALKLSVKATSTVPTQAPPPHHTPSLF